MLRFEVLDKSVFEKLSRCIFAILAHNMTAIAPTGNSYEEDYIGWNTAVSEGLQKEARSIVLIYFGDDLIGFFQYYANPEGVLMMEEIQISPDYQGKGYGIFRELYRFLFSILPADIKSVEAYANKNNQKSQDILHHLDLQIIGENKNGNSFHYRGDFDNLKKWYYSKP